MTVQRLNLHLHQGAFSLFCFMCLLSVTDSCWTSSLTQQGRDWTMTDRCLVHSLSSTPADSEWQMARWAEGPPPAALNVSLFVLQRIEELIVLLLSIISALIPGKRQSLLMCNRVKIPTWEVYLKSLCPTGLRSDDTFIFSAFSVITLRTSSCHMLFFFIQQAELISLWGFP